jgi:putative ABC transport system permease protein
MNPTRIWLGPGELSWHYPVGASQNVFVGVRLDRDEDVTTQWQAFNQEVGGAFNGLYYARDDLLFNFGLLFNLIASGLLVVAMISLAISFFVIYTTIHGAVVADYRQIGVLKSLGFTPGGIILGYSLQLLYIAGIFVPLGLVGGYFAQQVIGAQLSQSIGLVSSQGEFGLLALFTFTGLAVFVFGVSSLVARRAGKIKTVEAIRLGEAPEPQVKGQFVIGAQSRSPLVLLLALKTMFTRKRRLVLSGMTILLSTFVFAFCLNLNNFFDSEGSRAEFWGSPKADFSISLQVKRFLVDPKVFVDDVSRNPDVSVFVAQDWIDFAIPERGKEKARVIYGVMVDAAWTNWATGI